MNNVKRFSAIGLLFVFVVACEGEEGPQGPQGIVGPKGDQGETGDCSGCPGASALDLLEKIMEVDGAESGLDADTLDGTQLVDIMDRISALENQVAALETQNHELQEKVTVLQDHALYVFDGEDRLLGRVIDMNLDSVVFRLTDISYPVEVFIDDIDGVPTGTMGSTLYYSEADCEGLVYLKADAAARAMAILDPTTGTIYSPNSSPPGNISNHSSKFIVGEGEVCVNGTTSELLQSLSTVGTIDPFTPGVYLGELP